MTATTFPTHIPSIPYSDPPSRLQTLEVWLPRPLEETTSQNANSIWLIYIHGGGWREPDIEAISFEHTIKHLVASYPSTLANVAGIASLNYRLSPYPDHTLLPSTPGDPERSAKHPQHIRDVARAIQYLQREYSVKRWIGIGHSCGATMLCQLVNGIGLTPELMPAPGPEAMILLAGLYDLQLHVRNHLPPKTPAHVTKILHEFITLAFGEDEKDWLAGSPVVFKYDAQRWPEGKLVMLCSSDEDELVETQQSDVMRAVLDKEGWSTVTEGGDEEKVKAEGRRVLIIRDLKGSHNWIWEDGKQIAALVAEAVERLV